jgi:hypothetical protein
MVLSTFTAIKRFRRLKSAGLHHVLSWFFLGRGILIIAIAAGVTYGGSADVMVTVNYE